MHVLGEGPSDCSLGCFDPVLRPCILPIFSCPSSSQSDQGDQGPENQGNLGMPSVAFSPLVGLDGRDDGGAPHGAALLQEHPEDPGRLPSEPYLDPLVALHISGKNSS